MEWHAELEALVRERPEDDSVWSVLEDWTLERGDLRARIIERLNAGDEPGAQNAIWALEEALFGVSRTTRSTSPTCRNDFGLRSRTSNSGSETAASSVKRRAPPERKDAFTSMGNEEDEAARGLQAWWPHGSLVE